MPNTSHVASRANARKLDVCRCCEFASLFCGLGVVTSRLALIFVVSSRDVVTQARFPSETSGFVHVLTREADESWRAHSLGALLQSLAQHNPKPCASRMENEESEGEVVVDAADAQADVATPAYGPCGASARDASHPHASFSTKPKPYISSPM